MLSNFFSLECAYPSPIFQANFSYGCSKYSSSFLNDSIQDSINVLASKDAVAEGKLWIITLSLPNWSISTPNFSNSSFSSKQSWMSPDDNSISIGCKRGWDNTSELL